MDNYQYELVRVVEYWLSNERLTDKIHGEISHQLGDRLLVREWIEYLTKRKFNQTNRIIFLFVPNVI